VLDLNQIEWSFPIKVKSRKETIIDLYLELFGRESLPLHKTYWSMAGQCYNNGPVHNCEYDQLVKSGFLKSTQFHGVEINRDIHSQNTKITDTQWHLGHFVDVLEQHTDLNPGVIRYDGTAMPQTCAKDLADIINILTECNIHDVLVLFSVAVEARSHKLSVADISSTLQQYPSFCRFYKQGKWSHHPRAYTYVSNVARTVMATVAFWRY